MLVLALIDRAPSSTIHLMLALQGAVDVLGLRFSRGPVRCADCNRKIRQRQGKMTDDGAGQSLLHTDEESDDDVEGA